MSIYLNKKFEKLYQEYYSESDNLSVQQSNRNSDKTCWLKNLTDKPIPKEVIEIFSLGDKFNFQTSLSDKDIFDILKDLERNLGNKEKDNKLRRLIIGEVNKYIHNKPHIAFIDKIIEKKLKITTSFSAENKDILVTKADKGQITVVIGDIE